MRLFVALCMAWLICPNAYAEVYKCQTKTGVVYQQAPCSESVGTVGDAMQKKKDEREAYERDAQMYGRPGQDVPDSICAKQLTSHFIFKDPNSVIIESTTRMPPEIKYVSGIKSVIKNHYLMVNAKNSYGGYVGAKLYICRLSEDEKSIISIEPS